MTIGGEWKELLRASADGDIPLVKYHLAHGTDPNWQHPEYFTAPIFEGIRNGQMEVVKVLLEEGGADPSLVEEMTDFQPLEVAIEERRHKIVDLLLEKLPPEQASLFLKNILVTTTGNNKNSVIYNNYTELVKELLKSGHRVTVLSEDGEDTKNEDVLPLAEILKKETGNKKLRWILDMQKLRITDTSQQQNKILHNVWIHIHDENINSAAAINSTTTSTTTALNEFLDATCRKIKIVPNRRQATTLALLTTLKDHINSSSDSSTSTITYIIEPNVNSWYNQLTWSWWYPKYLETIVNFVTTTVYVNKDNDLRGKVYNYQGVEM